MRRNFKLIKWQLPISYAAVALLSSVVLGTILLISIRNYYMNRELEYLEDNANILSETVAQLLTDDVPPALIQSQLASFAFLSQVRVQLLDAHDVILVDSGVPQRRNLLSISAEQQQSLILNSRDTGGFGLPNLLPEDAELLQAYPNQIRLDDGSLVTEYYTPIISLDYVRIYPEGQNEATVNYVDDQSQRSSSDEDPYSHTLLATGTLYGFGLGDEIAQDEERSEQVVEQILVNTTGEMVGTLILSNGPAYGREIVNRVAYGLIFAGVVAMSIAVVAGLSISRRITVPLSMLTNITTSMAEGKLNVRIKLDDEGELGFLASSFNTMAERVQATITTLRRFVADAAHELHTPLTALHTSLELATVEPDSQKLYIERALHQLKRLETLTDSLLDLSRIDGGVTSEHFTSIDLNSLIQELSELYASRSEQAKVNFALSMPKEQIIVHGNINQLRSAVRNLLDNALKFTPNGETISVAVLNSNEMVAIEIKDNGIGIPEEELPYIFGRFYRCRNSMNYAGNGLGLAIVDGIIRSHNGTISVKNNTPTGTCFTIYLPATFVK